MKPLTVLTCPGVQETSTAPHIILECPGTHPVWQSALDKADDDMEGHPMQGAWTSTAMTEAAQRGHLMGSTAIFPLEVEQRLRGNSTKALVQGLFALDRDLTNGHAALIDALAAEVKARPDAKKAMVRAVRAQAQGAQGAAPVRRPPKRAQ